MVFVRFGRMHLFRSLASGAALVSLCSTFQTKILIKYTFNVNRQLISEFHETMVLLWHQWSEKRKISKLWRKTDNKNKGITTTKKPLKKKTEPNKLVRTWCIFSIVMRSNILTFGSRFIVGLNSFADGYSSFDWFDWIWLIFR